LIGDGSERIQPEFLQRFSLLIPMGPCSVYPVLRARAIFEALSF
jgi:hypothetical protein